MKHYFSTIILGLGLTLMMASCKGDNANSNSVLDTEPMEEVAKKKVGNDSTSIAMAFYHQDSVATQFRFYREIDSLLKAKELDYSKELEKKIRAYQAYEADIQKRMENNEITGYQIEDIQRTALQKQQQIQQYEQQKGEELQRETIQYQMALMNKIAEAGRLFSETKNIDLLFFYQKGGQITFINNAFDVTDEFISFLNKREDELMSGFEEEVEALEGQDLSGGLK